MVLEEAEEGGEAVEGHARCEAPEGSQRRQGETRRRIDRGIHGACDLCKSVCDGREGVEESLLPQLGGFVAL